MIPDAKKYDYPSREFYKLDGIKTCLEQMGNPQWGRKTILIAGTNGKGSLSAFLSRLFRQAGFLVGTYTSPHVVSETERIRINEKPISEEDFLNLKKEYQTEREPLTYFENLTALSFLWFQKQKVDWQVIEVGIGGRLDATNVCDPDVSVICRLGLDHEDVLGKGLLNIASEKAGVMRRGRPCFAFRPAESEVEQKLWDEAKRYEAELNFLEDSAIPSDWKALLDFEFKSKPKWLRENANLAVFTFLQLVNSLDVSQSISQFISQSIPKGAKDYSLKDAEFLARAQILRESPLVLVDGAHNELGVKALRSFLDENYPDEKFAAVFGCLSDREAERLLAPLDDRIGEYFCPSYFPPRETKPNVIKEIIRSQFSKKAEIDLEMLQLIKRLKSLQKPALIFGSFYLAGEFLKAWESDE